VFDASGRLMRQYSGNVTIRNGRAAYQIPWALNDQQSSWILRARDVVSGHTAEITLSPSGTEL